MPFSGDLSVQKKTTIPVRPVYRCSHLTNGLIRCGVAKSEKHANVILLGLVIFNIGITFFILSWV